MLRLMRLIWRALAFPGHFMQTGCTAGWGEVGHSARSSFKSVPLCWQKSDASPATRLASNSSTMAQNYKNTRKTIDKSPDRWNTILTKEKIRINDKNQTTTSQDIRPESDQCLALSFSPPMEKHPFFEVLPEGGDPPAQIVLDFFTGTNFEHKFIVFLYVVITLSFDDISTDDKCNFLILLVMT